MMLNGRKSDLLEAILQLLRKRGTRYRITWIGLYRHSMSIILLLTVVLVGGERS